MDAVTSEKFFSSISVLESFTGMVSTLSKLLFAAIALQSLNSSACETANSRHEAAVMLYEDSGFRNFACGSDEHCDEATMEDYLQFHISKLRKAPFKVCFVDSIANVKNRYTGVFTFDEATPILQMIVFNTDIKPMVGPRGRVNLIISLVTDDSNEDAEHNRYEWHGKKFLELGSPKNAPRHP